MALNPLLHYDSIAEFNKQYYKDLLGASHILDGEMLFKSLHDADGESFEGAIPGYPLTKDGVKYILPSKHKDEDGTRHIDLMRDLPIRVTMSEKVFSNGTGYQHIKKFKTARFKPERRLTFRELVDKLCEAIPHSNEDHNKLAWFLALTSMFTRFNCRVCSPPAFGKDSRVEVMGNLIGNASSIVNPTLAKLELLSISNEWLAVNEVVDMTKTDWRNTEQYLLNCGDFSPTVTKRSRAYGHVGETLNVENLSLSLFYNDVDQYPDLDKFFDEYTKGAVKDRFLPLRLYGHYTANFNDITKVNVKEFVKENTKQYEDLLRTYLFYKDDLDSHLHYYKLPDLSRFSERWKTNLGKLLKVIDIYSSSQEEFNHWWRVIKRSIDDYFAMTNYPAIVSKVVKKKGQVATDKFINTKIKNVNTFIEKNELLEGFAMDSIKTGGGLNDF